MQWEYLVEIEEIGDGRYLAHVLNRYGANGWELMGIFPHANQSQVVLILRRKRKTHFIQSLFRFQRRR
ncbi:DUF4177 domain-containing protein [Caldicoprobacter faecalis]|uniref:DUF4177 domain-containing protein n=1 Tax=Caldicoprobacter faecalis TaxID=937334 RepID=UPI000B820FE5|nr:DUF4177 domain-containing protein [Caldicoprobacter faecalis]